MQSLWLKSICRSVDRERAEISCHGPRDTFGGPAVAQKYKVHVHKNAPFEKRKILKIFPQGPLENVSLGPTVALDVLLKIPNFGKI